MLSFNDDEELIDSEEDDEKNFSFIQTLTFNKLNDKIEIKLNSTISSESLTQTGDYLWQCSIILTNYLNYIYNKKDWNNDDFPLNKYPKIILELGCGLALPSLLHCKLNENHISILTDKLDEHFLQRCDNQLKLNKINENQFKIVPLDWGYNFTYFLNDKSLQTNLTPDLIIATDCLYDKKLYDDFFSTFYFLKIFYNKIDLPLLLCYFQRNESDNITFQLKKWNLKAKIVEWKFTLTLEEFLIIYPYSDENTFYSLLNNTQLIFIK